MASLFLGEQVGVTFTRSVGSITSFEIRCIRVFASYVDTFKIPDCVYENLFI